MNLEKKCRVACERLNRSINQKGGDAHVEIKAMAQRAMYEAEYDGPKERLRLIEEQMPHYMKWRHKAAE